MRRILLAVSAVTMLMTGMAFAETETPVVDQRQANQEQRIDQGVASGHLNDQKATQVNKQQKHVNKKEDKAVEAYKKSLARWDKLIKQHPAEEEFVVESGP